MEVEFVQEIGNLKSEIGLIGNQGQFGRRQVFLFPISAQNQILEQVVGIGWNQTIGLHARLTKWFDRTCAKRKVGNI